MKLPVARPKMCCIILFSLTVLPIVVVCWFFISLFTPRCSNTIITSALSPDGVWKSFVFERNCGATTGFSTQVLIRPNDGLFVYDEKNVVYITKGLNPIRLWWISSTQLVIESQLPIQESQVFRRESTWNGIFIRYKESPTSMKHGSK